MSGHTLTADDLDNLRHTLGVDMDKPPNRWGWRNYFATTEADPSFVRLVAVGFAIRIGESAGRDAVFAATRDGCRAVGMTDAQIDRSGCCR